MTLNGLLQDLDLLIANIALLALLADRRAREAAWRRIAEERRRDAEQRRRPERGRRDRRRPRDRPRDRPPE